MSVSSIRDMVAIQGFLPYLELEVAGLNKALDNKVMGALTRNELTPELAMYAWIEKATYAKLLSRFSQAIRMGQAEGTKLSDTMNT